MKKIIQYIAIFEIIFFQVNCTSDNGPSSNGKLVSLEVKEYKTNLPLSGAKVTSYSCGVPDIEFSCIRFDLFSSCITDNDGICNLRYPDYFEKVRIEKSNYWSRSTKEKAEEYFIHPKAWVDISFKTDFEYPATSTFFIFIDGEESFERHYIQETGNFNNTFTLFGNEENVIKWTLYEKFNASSLVLNSGEFKMSPEKFEILTLELAY